MLSEEPEEVTPPEHLRLRSVTVIGPTEVVFDFEGSGTPDRRFVVTKTDTGGIPLLSFEDEFARLYGGVPCLSLDVPFLQLASKAFDAYNRPLPVGQAWIRASDECVEQARRESDS